MNKKLSENIRGGAFPDEETFQKIYEECLENQPSVSEEFRKSYNDLRDAFDTYLAFYNEHMFRYAYQCGYEAAQKGGGVA